MYSLSGVLALLLRVRLRIFLHVFMPLGLADIAAVTNINTTCEHSSSSGQEAYFRA